MQENPGTVMATKANNVDGFEVPFQKQVGKLLGKFGLEWPDLLIIIALLETAWWITFGFLDGADVTLRTTFDYDDQLYPVYMVVKRTVCLARLASVIWCIWYSCIIQGKPAPLGFYIVSSLLLDSCVIAWDLVQIYCYDVKSSLFNISYGCYFTIAFYFTRVFVYWMVGCCAVEIFRENGGKNLVDKLAFIGKGWGEIARFYKLQEERAALLALAFDVLWSTSLFILHQLPIIMFQTTYVGIFGLSPEIQICLGSVMHPNVSFIFGVMGIVAFKCKSRGLVFGWLFVTIFYIVLSVMNLITFVVIAFGMERFNNVVPVYLGMFTMYFDLRVSVCYLVLRGYWRLGEAASSTKPDDLC